MYFRMIFFESLVLFSHTRWLVVPFFAGGSTLLVVAEMASNKWGLELANQWDVLLGLFNDPFKVAVLLPAIFFAMISDVITRDFDGWGYLVWNRTSSRAAWWWSKLGVLGLAAFIYTSVIWLIAVLISLVTTEVELPWSRLITLSQWVYPGGLDLQHQNVPPPVIMFKIWGLTVWGLFALGTAVAVLAFVFRNAGIAWMVGAASCLLSYGTWVVAPRYASWAPTLQLLLKAHREFSDRVPSSFTLEWSFVGNGLLLLITAGTGYVIWLRQDL